MTIVIVVILFAAAVYLTFYACYLLLLLVASLIPSRRFAVEGKETTRFGIVIPAHDEEMFLGRLLSAINLQNYPKTHYDAIVVADNCIDNTASVAHEHGAVVYERRDLTAIGKGYALKYGIENMQQDKYDALVIVDADCTLDANVLRVFDGYIRVGMPHTSVDQRPCKSRPVVVHQACRCVALRLQRNHPQGKEEDGPFDPPDGHGDVLHLGGAEAIWLECLQRRRGLGILHSFAF